MIQVDGYCKLYGDQLAVSDLSFTVGAGEILGLVGPNGAGKTTTLRAIAGILSPSKGSLSVAGFDLAKQPIEAKKRLAMLPDDPSLFESLTAWEHLEFTAHVYDVADWQPKASELVARLELTDHLDKMADELSHGMRQKVAVACALLHDPVALLLDEPLTGLDPRGIRTLFSALAERARAGAAVILSTHLLQEIEDFCTKFLILRTGKRLFYGSKEEIRAELATLKADASLEEIFFAATEGRQSP